MLRDPRAFYHGAYADALVIAVSTGAPSPKRTSTLTT